MALMMANIAQGIGVDWAQRQFDHVIHLLSTQGESAKQTVSDILATIRFFTGKQFIQAFGMLSQDVSDVQAIIKAIQNEWNS